MIVVIVFEDGDGWDDGGDCVKSYHVMSSSWFGPNHVVKPIN